MGVTGPVALNKPGPQPREPIIISTIADATGRAVATSNPVVPGYRILLDYVVITTTSTTPTAFTLYVGTIENRNLLDGTPTLGNSSVAAYMPARILLASMQLNAVWTGATPGALCMARFEFRQERT